MNMIAFRSGLTQLLPQVPHPMEMAAEVEPDGPAEYTDTVPSPEEIQRRCQEIQKEWTPRERMKRAGKPVHRHRGWTPPIVHVCEMEP